MMCIEISMIVPLEKTLGSSFSGICKNAVIQITVQESRVLHDPGYWW